jgi:hypothetical protein
VVAHDERGVAKYRSETVTAPLQVSPKSWAVGLRIKWSAV